MTTSSSRPPLPHWRFWLPLAAQLAIIIGVPAQAIYTYTTGTSVILQTAPVDPYDLLRGYSQTLNYEISQAATLETLPGWDAVVARQEDQPNQTLAVYITLERPDSPPTDTIPDPWQPVAIAPDFPTALTDNQVVLTGRLSYQWVQYGLERYYMPEDQRDTINTEIMELNREFQNEPPPVVVEVRVARNGTAVPVSLWVSDRQYRF
jgi:uncharacterized membrane-anchored protein